ncbi:MAG: hypothetical protein JKY37_23440 [Nannocystaceae bacterium]|nr:hypothetical protein [Nannocystaceae bacterium]
MADPTIELMEALNQRCRCIGLDSDLLAERLDRDEPKLFETILADKPHMFAAFPVFIPRAHVSAMQRVVSAIEDVAALPAYRAHVLKGRPEIARVDHGPTGVFYGHDFHLGAAGPQLIEINTNAGGAMLNVALAEAQRACCSEVEAFENGPHDVAALEQTFVDMFRAEYRAQRGDAPLRRIAIVDLEPEKQYLYPDFRLVQRMLARAGIDTVLADPTALRLTGDGLVHERGPVDLVYNRLTDFYLEDHEQLREAYVRGTTVVTPNPHGYALHADKRNLVVLSDPELLAELGVPTELREVLAAGIPRTIRVTRANADELWSRRKQLFFKPTTGFGGERPTGAPSSLAKHGTRSWRPTTLRSAKSRRASERSNSMERRYRSSWMSADLCFAGRSN